MALIMVLWVISLMTIMAGSFSLTTRRETEQLTHAHERAKATALAEGAINYAMFMLSLPNQQFRWKSDGTPYLWQFEKSVVRIRILDEGGKVDLNAAQEQTLKTTLRFALGNEEQANRLGDIILDWRDQDDTRRSSGAEMDDYLALKSQSPPQNRNFLILDELRGVLGITPKIYRQLENWFTLYSGSDGLNTSKASPEILMALMRGDRSAVESYLVQRQQTAPGLPGPQLPPIAGLPNSSVADAAFSVIAESAIGDGQRFGVIATIRRGGSNGSPFTYLRWKPYQLPPERPENRPL